MLLNRYRKILIFSFAFCVLRFTLICFADSDFTYDAKGKRNPFIPLVSPEGRLMRIEKEETKGSLKVEGIIYDKAGRSFAIVNGAVVGVGDEVGDYQVLKIEDNKVIFIKDGQAVEVELKKTGDRNENE